MSLSMKFSDVHGENVSLTREKNSASWKHLYSGGMVFSQLPLSVGNPVKLNIRGTSIVHIGFYNGDPGEISNVKELYLNKNINLIGQLNVYKKKCFAHLKRTTSSFTYTHADITYTKNISQGTDIWIAIYIQLGDACIKMCSENDATQLMPFHMKHGNNIQFFDKTRTTAKLQIKNLAATACIELNPTEEKAISVTLRLKPCMPGIKQYGLSLSASHSSSKFLGTFYEYMFMTDSKIQKQQNYTVIQSFERKSSKFNTCDGELTIKVEHGGRVKYHHDSVPAGSAQVTELHSQSSGGITLILDIFQVSVDIIDACEYDARCGSDDDEECSSMSSVNSTSVISTCLDRSLNSPTTVHPLFRRHTSVGIPDDSSSQDKTELSTDELSTTAFKQPQNGGKTSAPKDRERLDAWVHATTKFHTPEFPTGVRFFFAEDKYLDTVQGSSTTEAVSSRKRTDVSCSEGPDVQPKHARLHTHSNLDESEIEQRSLVPRSASSRHTDISCNDRKYASGETQEDLYCEPRSSQTEKLEQGLIPIKKTNSSTFEYFVSPHEEVAHIRPSPLNDGMIISTDKNRGESQRTSPTNARLQLKRSQMGVRITLPLSPTIDEQRNSGALSSRKQTDRRPIQHQMTYPNLASATNNSDLFHDDYKITLQEKATSKHFLKDNIRRNYTSLVDNLVVVPLIDHLYEVGILGDEEHENMKSCKQSYESNRSLLSILRRKPVDKDKFTAALRKSNLEHLVSMFV